MRSFPAWLRLSFVALLTVGCGQNPSPPTADSASPRTTGAEYQAEGASTAASFSTPDAAVSAFLEALRDGDDALAEAILTPKAREETAKRNLAVQPPGTPNASFRIGKIEYLSADKTGAHVNSTWTEQDQQQGPSSFEIVWALRRQADGWRIAGMAAQVTPTEPPVFLNFEDPDDMLEKCRAAEERLATQNDNTLRQAGRIETSPATSSTNR